MSLRTANCLPLDRPLPTAIEASRRPGDGARQYAPLIPLVRQPWLLRVGATSLLIRPAVARDLEGVASMHARCSAASLLERYRTGGRGASVAALHRHVRRPLAFVAAAPGGAVRGFAVAGIDANHGRDTAEIGLLVEDEWQGLGIGRELLVHLAGGALVCGYCELVAYTATSIVPIRRLLAEVGPPRIATDPAHPHLHLTLPESAALGLGAVRERLAS